MRKRGANYLLEDEPPRKKASGQNSNINSDVKSGDVLTDVFGKQWRLGKAIGVGAFGEVFLASDKVKHGVNDSCRYVAKIERHTNGPLFVEINCYLRVARQETIEEWKKANKLQTLGMPYYVASGSYSHYGSKYRFLILPRYDTDLEDMLEKREGRLHPKTVLTISLQLLDVLQYIHNKGFIHADIKASNMLLNFSEITSKQDDSEKSYIRLFHPIKKFRSCRLATTFVINKNLRSNSLLHCIGDVLDNKKTEQPAAVMRKDQMYLLDYGLASKYVQSNGEHKQYTMDRRRAHAGTLLFCSLDAHKGALSRKSDLESLGYNIIYWLTSTLPWCDDLDDPEVVMRKKDRCMSELEPFLIFCFGNYPKFLLEYFTYINGLDGTAKPDYKLCKRILEKGLYECGYKYDSKFDFDKKLNKSVYKRKQTNSENMKCKKIAYVINRVPLKSNLPIKPVLRKKNKNKKLRMMKWSQILMDPETILKQAKIKERKLTESNEETQCLSNINIKELNPTEAMMEVYNNYIERIRASDGMSPKYKSECNPSAIEGYTSAMIHVYNKMIERNALEMELISIKNNKRLYQSRSDVIPPAIKRRGRPCKKRGLKTEVKCEPKNLKSCLRLYSVKG